MKRGFTLVELVIVIVILGILAAIAMPRFFDIITDAKISATQGGLGAIRGVVALKYAQTLTQTGTASFPSTITSTDFFDGNLPVNKLVGTLATAVSTLTAVPAGTATQATDSTIGWWLVYENATTNTQNGRVGAYVDVTTRDSSTW